MSSESEMLGDSATSAINLSFFYESSNNLICQRQRIMAGCHTWFVVGGPSDRASDPGFVVLTLCQGSRGPTPSLAASGGQLWPCMTSFCMSSELIRYGTM